MAWQFSIHCASKEISLEAGHELYDHPLCFSFTDWYSAWPYPPWIVKGIPRFTLKDLERTVIGRFKNITFEIEAPSADSCISYSHRALSTCHSLRQIFASMQKHHSGGIGYWTRTDWRYRIPEITVALVNNKYGKWTRSEGLYARIEL